MTVDDRGARPLSGSECRRLADVERGFAADTGLRAALRHGVATGAAPRPGVLALCLLAGCVTLTVTALAVGPEVALLVALGGALALATMLVAVGRRRGPGSARRP